MAAISVGVCPDAPSSSTGQEVTIPGPAPRRMQLGVLLLGAFESGGVRQSGDS